MRESRLLLLVVATAMVVGLVWFLVRGQDAASPAGSVLSRGADGGPVAAPEFPQAAGDARDVETLGTAAAAEPLPSPEESAAVAPKEQPTPPTTIITGRIVDAEGAPMVGADILFGASRTALWLTHWDLIRYGIDRVMSHATSSPDGRFELGVIVPAVADLRGEPLQPRLVVLHRGHAVTVRRYDNLPAGPVAIGDIALDSGATVMGRVVTSARGPITDADVTVENAEPASGAHATSDRADEEIRQWFLARRTPANGTFECTGLRPGDAALTVEAEGVGRAVEPGLHAAAGVPVDVGDIVIAAGAVIAGVVMDAHHNPLANASVQVETIPETRRAAAASNAASLGLTSGWALSADDGRFSAGGLAPGVYDVHVSLDDHAWSRVFDVPTGTSDLVITMQRLGTILLTVVDEADGRPIVGALVKASFPLAEQYQPWGDGQFSVATGEGAQLRPGEYRVGGAGPEGTELRIAAAGHVTRTETARGVSAEETVALTVRLRRTLEIAGVVRDDAGAPVAGATVGATSTEMPGADTQSDGRGFFSIGVAGDGTWTVSALAPGFAQAGPVNVTLGPGGQREPLTVVMLRAGSLVGTFFDPAALPVSGGRVFAAARGAPGSNARERYLAMRAGSAGVAGSLHAAVSDAAGRFTFAELDPGRYAVWTERGGDLDMTFGAVCTTAPEDSWTGQVGYADVRSGATAILDLHEPRPGSVHGNVTAGGVAAPGSAVAISLADIDYTSLNVDVASRTTTDELGAFEISGLRPANYVVLALVPGVPVPRMQRVRVGAGERALADFAFRGPTVSGVVVDDPAGTPVPGIRLRVRVDAEAGHESDGEKAWPRSFENVANTLFGGTCKPFETTTGADGRFELRFLEPGTCRLWLSGSSYLSTATSFPLSDTAGAGERTIAMVRGAVVEGTVQPPGLSPLPRLRAEIFEERPEGSWRRGSMELDEGKFRFDALEAGRYTVKIVSVFSVAEVLGSRAVTLLRGQTTSIVVGLDP